MDPVTIGLLTGLALCLAAVSVVLVLALRRIDALEDRASWARENILELNEDVIDMREDARERVAIERERNAKTREQLRYLIKQVGVCGEFVFAHADVGRQLRAHDARLVSLEEERARLERQREEWRKENEAREAGREERERRRKEFVRNAWKDLNHQQVEASAATSGLTGSPRTGGSSQEEPFR